MNAPNTLIVVLVSWMTVKESSYTALVVNVQHNSVQQTLIAALQLTFVIKIMAFALTVMKLQHAMVNKFAIIQPHIALRLNNNAY